MVSIASECKVNLELKSTYSWLLLLASCTASQLATVATLDSTPIPCRNYKWRMCCQLVDKQRTSCGRMNYYNTQLSRKDLITFAFDIQNICRAYNYHLSSGGGGGAAVGRGQSRHWEE